MSDYRLPTSGEKRLIRALMERSRCPSAFLEHLDALLVKNMDDGGMGSLRVLLPARSASSEVMKSQAAELQFTDADGEVVIASLHVNEDGLPLEIDVWKPAFSPLVRIPDDFMDVVYGQNPKKAD